MTGKRNDRWVGIVRIYILAAMYGDASLRKTCFLKDFPLYLELTRLLTTIQRLLTSQRCGILF